MWERIVLRIVDAMTSNQNNNWQFAKAVLRSPFTVGAIAPGSVPVAAVAVCPPPRSFDGARACSVALPAAKVPATVCWRR